MKLALLGVGLIGGSFAKALRAAGRTAHVIGFDVDPSALQRGVAHGVIDACAYSSGDAVTDADLVIVATPVGQMMRIFQDIAPHLGGHAIVTDVGSVKASVIQDAKCALGSAFPRFVPGHPIAGSERSGVQHSDASLFDGSVCVLTPVDATELNAQRLTEDLWTCAGCRIERMSPVEHDEVFAGVSHLPHLLAFALIHHIGTRPDANRRFELAGRGLRDFTRLAASDPKVWCDICIANSTAIGTELSRYAKLLDRVQLAVVNRDAAALRQIMTPE